MSSRRKGGFFGQDTPRPEDELARQRDVEALLAPRRLVAQDLPIERIRPNPFQARRTFDGLEEFAQAIQAQGFITRLRVRPDPAESGFFQLVFGERRLRAAKQAGLTTVPCEIAEHTDDELIEIGLAENIQRRDLDPLEEAQAFRLFIDQRNYTVRRLAERIGKDKSYVDDRLALLRAPDDIQQMIVQRPDALRAAREISKLDSPLERQPLIEGIVTGTLNTQAVRAKVREELVGSPNQEQLTSAIPQPQDLPSSNIYHKVEREAKTLRATLSGWRKMSPDFNTAEREFLLSQINQILTEMQALSEALQLPAEDPQ